MKWIFYCLLLVSIPHVSVGQGEGALSKIPRKVDKIVMTNDSSAVSNYDRCKRIMASHNIELASQVPEMHQLRTGRIPGKGNSEMYCLIWCNDSSIVIKGMWKLGLTIWFSEEINNKWQVISNSGMSANKAFGAFNDFALLFKTKNIFYEISQ